MGLVDRVKNILLNPRQEWEVVDAESATVGSLYTGYIVPLAAIPAVCQAIGFSVFGMRLPFVGTWRMPLGSSITRAAEPGARSRRSRWPPTRTRRRGWWAFSTSSLL